MRKLFFYFFICRKVLLLLLYPVFERKGKIFLYLRKNIEDFLIFQPSRLRARKIQAGLLKKIQPQRFLTPDGIKLYAWFIRPKGKNPVFLHFHGQAESILSHQDIALYCLRNGFGLFMLSYRGHYKSGGFATESGLYTDAASAIVQLKKLGVDKDKIILWGHSLGSAVAVETALNNEVCALILQNPIKEIKSAAQGVFNFYCNKMNLPILAKLVRPFIEKMNLFQKFDNIGKISKISCPILVLHAKSDKVASFQNSVELCEKNSKAQLYLSQDGTHWDSHWCFERIKTFAKATEEEKLALPK